jgi:transposase InsO family protein
LLEALDSGGRPEEAIDGSAGRGVGDPQVGTQPLFIEPGSPWENGYCECFNGKLRDECLNGEIFYSLDERRKLSWRHYNTVSAHSTLGYRPPAPLSWVAAA